jgi:hypothetical protein
MHVRTGPHLAFGYGSIRGADGSVEGRGSIRQPGQRTVTFLTAIPVFARSGSTART